MHPSSPVIRRKNLQSNGSAQAAVAATKKDQAGAAESVIEVEERGEPILRFTGYQTVIFGEIYWWLVILTSMHWICIYVLVLLDEYFQCQLTGIDNLCFYGTYFVFGSYDQNGTAFFTLWCLSLVWFTTLGVYKREVHNWFRMPCSLSTAHVVYAWAQDQAEVLSINVSALVHFVRKVKDTFSRSERRGHGETIAVARTDMGTLHFLFQGQRYLIARDILHLAQVEVSHRFGEFYKLSGGLSRKEAVARYDKLGPNEAPFKPETIWVSIAEEMFTLFKV